MLRFDQRCAKNAFVMKLCRNAPICLGFAELSAVVLSEKVMDRFPYESCIKINSFFALFVYCDWLFGVTYLTVYES